MVRSWRVDTEELPVVKLRIVYMLVSFVLCVALAMVAASAAKADYQYGPYAPLGQTFPSDSNRYVPEYYSGPNVGSCYNNVIGFDDYYYDYSVWYGPVVHYITYDSCEMNRLGATSAGWSRLHAHERAHSRGWGHYEAPRSSNAAYYPTVDIY